MLFIRVFSREGQGPHMHGHNVNGCTTTILLSPLCTLQPHDHSLSLLRASAYSLSYICGSFFALLLHV